jgi:hypothetical protein
MRDEGAGSWRALLWLKEFKTIAERVLGVKAKEPREVVIPCDRDPTPLKMTGERDQISDENARVGLSCRGEVSFDAQMNFQATAPEPAAAPRGKRRRLVEFRHAQYPSPEAAALLLTAGGDGQLNVVQAIKVEALVIRHSSNCAIADLGVRRSLATGAVLGTTPRPHAAWTVGPPD